jgi:hypothetical protein
MGPRTSGSNNPKNEGTSLNVMAREQKRVQSSTTDSICMDLYKNTLKGNKCILRENPLQL